MKWLKSRQLTGALDPSTQGGVDVPDDRGWKSREADWKHAVMQSVYAWKSLTQQVIHQKMLQEDNGARVDSLHHRTNFAIFNGGGTREPNVCTWRCCITALFMFKHVSLWVANALWG